MFWVPRVVLAPCRERWLAHGFEYETRGTRKILFSLVGPLRDDLGLSPAQYESALMTSPPAIVPSALQVIGLIVFLMNRTEPSQNEVFTPPG